MNSVGFVKDPPFFWIDLSATKTNEKYEKINLFYAHTHKYTFIKHSPTTNIIQQKISFCSQIYGKQLQFAEN